jgi:hypothetical protein
MQLAPPTRPGRPAHERRPSDRPRWALGPSRSTARAAPATLQQAVGTSVETRSSPEGVDLPARPGQRGQPVRAFRAQIVAVRCPSREWRLPPRPRRPVADRVAGPGDGLRRGMREGPLARGAPSRLLRGAPAAHPSRTPGSGCRPATGRSADESGLRPLRNTTRTPGLSVIRRTRPRS